MKRKAFTLVEVLVTLVFMGIVLPVAMRGLSLSLAAASHARHMNEAASLAESKLNEIAIEGTLASPETSGDFGPDHPEYRFAVESNARDFGMTEMIVHVMWNEGAAEKSTSVATLIYQQDTGTTQ